MRGAGSPSIECKCEHDLTCGYCLRNAPLYFFTPTPMGFDMAYSNTAAKVRVAKRTYPHEYCKHFNCLWRTRASHARDAVVKPCPKHPNSVMPFPSILSAILEIEYPSECCQSCGAPFNNGNPSPSRMCTECEAQ